MRPGIWWGIACLLCVTTVVCAGEEEFNGEIMSVHGAVFLISGKASRRLLKEGDLLKAGDWVEVGGGGYADIAYDREWNNVTRIEENSKIQIRSVCPGSMTLQKGGVFAKLKALPPESSFEVQTPTAIAAARGTEFRTLYGENGSQVLNFSDSAVYVYGVDESGNISRTHEPLVLKNSEKTQVVRRGEFHFQSYRMALSDKMPGQKIQEHLEKKIDEFNQAGHIGKIQDLRKMDAYITDQIQKGNLQRPEAHFPGMQVQVVKNEAKPGPGNEVPRPGIGPADQKSKGPEREVGDKAYPPPAPPRSPERQDVPRQTQDHPDQGDLKPAGEENGKPQERRAVLPARPRPRQ